MLIIYIHGFGSSGFGAKAKLFRNYFQSIQHKFIAPSLSYIPSLALKTLEEIITASTDEILLIGSSLGGFYSIYLAEQYHLKAVLINPSVRPYETLSKVIGMQKNYYDGSLYEWRLEHIDELRKFEKNEISPDLYMLLLQTGDETLDYTQAQKKFFDAKLFVEEGGTHSFEGVERYFEKINSFFTS